MSDTQAPTPARLDEFASIATTCAERAAGFYALMTEARQWIMAGCDSERFIRYTVESANQLFRAKEPARGRREGPTVTTANAQHLQAIKPFEETYNTAHDAAVGVCDELWTAYWKCEAEYWDQDGTPEAARQAACKTMARRITEARPDVLAALPRLIEAENARAKHWVLSLEGAVVGLANVSTPPPSTARSAGKVAQHLAQPDSSSAQPAEVGVVVGDLASKLGVSSATINRYAKQAGLRTPGPGQKNFTYSQNELRLIANQMANAGSKHTRAAATKLRNEYRL